ncbi:hypothetical protein BH23GEM2_BH23GEM2_14870 [soil metagenome]
MTPTGFGALADYQRCHIDLAIALADGQDVPVETIGKQEARLALISRRERGSQAALAAVMDRTIACVGEILGGEPAPPVVQWRDGSTSVSVLEADVNAERLVKDFRAAGVQRSSDPAWRAKVNAAYSDLVMRYVQHMEQRATRARRPAVNVPSQELEALRERVAELETRAAAGADVPAIELDGRTLRIGNTTTCLPIPLYVGSWRAGDVSYARGDFVTHGGSMWHCHVSGTHDRPGTSADWQLAVKSGRDGRTAKGATRELK